MRLTGCCEQDPIIKNLEFLHSVYEFYTIGEEKPLKDFKQRWELKNEAGGKFYIKKN